MYDCLVAVSRRLSSESRYRVFAYTLLFTCLQRILRVKDMAWDASDAHARLAAPPAYGISNALALSCVKLSPSTGMAFYSIQRTLSIALLE
jgi:hypothetical protein